MESSKHYLEQLYPLQDKFLNFLEQSQEDQFYLTGGTALSRFYVQHRFSDDLDFFSKKELTDFRSTVNAILNAAKKYGFQVETETVSEHFFRIFIQQDDVVLKIDFVNESIFHWGEFNDFPLFSSVDNEINILANKLTCISRCEVKDIVDVWILARRLSFSWRELIDIANKKSSVDPLEVSKIIKTLPNEELNLIRWAFDVKPDEVYSDLQVISQDILLGQDNTLPKK